MAINIRIVKEDMTTVLDNLLGIEPNEDFYHLQEVAKKNAYYFTATIDEGSNTVFNYPQRQILEIEIGKMRSLNVNQSILDQLQAAIDACGDRYHVYLMFIGD